MLMRNEGQILKRSRKSSESLKKWVQVGAIVFPAADGARRQRPPHLAAAGRAHCAVRLVKPEILRLSQSKPQKSRSLCVTASWLLDKIRSAAHESATATRGPNGS